MELNKSEFRSWLETQPRDRACGFRNEGEGCPIAFWLGSTYGSSWLASPTSCLSTDGKEFLTPDWAVQFMMLVDANEDDPDRPEDIYPDEALGYLSEVE